MAPVVISGTTPAVKKDMVGSTYVIRQAEIATLPVDYIERLIAFQPSVANLDTALHVRGGRATEVLYMIDNVSIIDPQTGDPAISIAKGIIDEVIFLPGGFDAEYGRAMSGVVNLITEHPRDKLSGRLFGKTETIMPFYYDFGYQDYQATLHLPVSKRFKGLFAADLMHTDDWDPRLYILPHKQRDDYALYGKWLYSPSGKLNLSLSGAKSRTQFDRYYWQWKFNLDHYRSDFRTGDIEAVNLFWLPNKKNLLNLTASRLFTEKKYGLKLPDNIGIRQNFIFKDYKILNYPIPSNKNPFGNRYFGYKFMCEGDYPEYQEKSTSVITGKTSLLSQLNQYNELKTGFEYSLLDLYNLTAFFHDSLHQFIDQYHYSPNEISAYAQDNIDYGGLYAKIGVRYDYFSTGMPGLKSQMTLSPRLGASFQVTEKFIFRTDFGQYTQPPLYDQMFKNYSFMPNIPPGMKISLIGNPGLKPEKTRSYEIGLQGEINPNLIATVNTFYKDVADLIGTRFILALPEPYSTYFNVEYANIKGVEAILEFRNHIYNGKIAYTLSYARGSSSYAEEIYYRYYSELIDSLKNPPTQEYFLDFDQRHRLFIQGVFNMPWKTYLYVFGYFGQGFPYTPPGPEGKYQERNFSRMPFQKEIDCLITKNFKIGSLSCNLSCELINLLDLRYQISMLIPQLSVEEINKQDFNFYLDCWNQYYHPATDFNHDGLITPEEYYRSFIAINQATIDWVNAYTAPRRARIGLTVNF
jgi:outer membrane cobalamin receptor